METKDLIDRLKENGFCEKEDTQSVTLSKVMKWLRESHNIDISIEVVQLPKGYTPWVWKTDNAGNVRLVASGISVTKTYETACEKAIEYILKNNMLEN